MTTRMNLVLDQDSPLHDERWQQDPVIMDCIAIDTEILSEVVEFSTDTAVNGERIVTLLGADDPADPYPSPGHTIDTDAQKQELVRLLTDMIEMLDNTAQTEYSLKDLKTKDDTPSPESVLNEEDLRRLKIHMKATAVRDQVQFALDNGIDLRLG